MSRTKITCPVDGGSNCFHERLPEGDTYMSFDCGYATNAHYEIGSQAIENVLSKAPQLVKDLAFESKDRWGYRFAPEVSIPEEEKEDWPIPGQEGKFYSHRLDMENSRPYESFQFADAIANLGLVVENIKDKKED